MAITREFWSGNKWFELMSLFAEIFFVGKWDPEIGGRKLEYRVQKGDPIPEEHLRAWRIAREEILGNVLELGSVRYRELQRLDRPEDRQGQGCFNTLAGRLVEAHQELS